MSAEKTAHFAQLKEFSSKGDRAAIVKQVSLK
jgi:hypothetical protein